MKDLVQAIPPALEGVDNSLNPNKIKYVNDLLQRRFDGISPDSS